MKNTIEIHQVDVFTEKLFSGNPATVVFNADNLSEETMINISAEMDNDETAFVMKPQNPKAQILIKFFTPKGVEIPFTGHATVGTLFEMAYLNLFGLGEIGTNQISVETKAGLLTLWTEVSKDKIYIKMSVPKIELGEYKNFTKNEFEQKFGLPVNSITNKIPIIYEKHLKYLYIPIRTLDVLSKCQFDFEKIRKNFKKQDITLFCLYTNKGFDKNSDIHSRVVAPLIGFTGEDSFTGSTQAVICTVARKYGLLDNTRNEYHVEQGDYIGMPGRAIIAFKNDIPYVKATGQHVFTAQMRIA